MAEQRHTFPKSERLCGRLRMKEVATSGKSVTEASIPVSYTHLTLPTRDLVQTSVGPGS